MYKFISVSISLVIAVANSLGQQQKDKKLAKDLDGLISGKFNTVAPGLVVLVAKKGQVIYEQAFGTANIELDVAMKPGMVFRIGSITKQFTAIGILQLVEHGKISLDDSIQKFIKNFPYKGHTITIENLLTHTSGIKDYGLLDAHIPNAIRVEFPAQQIIDSLAVLALDFIPSAKYAYSNSNYFLLGYIIEKVSGKSYNNYLQDNIFEPASLLNTFYDSPTKIINGRASGYTKDGAAYQNVDYMSMSLVYSAGALLSSVQDLYKWHLALHSYTLVKKETLEKAFTPFRLSDGQSADYGHGWFIKEWKGTRSIGHAGAIDGFRGIEMYFPEKDIYITSLFNSDNDHFLNFFEEIADRVLGNSITAWKDLTLADSTLKKYTGIYTFFEDSTQYLKIYQKNGRLYADLSNNSGRNMAMLAQSQVLFYLPDVRRIPTTIEFIMENGTVKGLIWKQEKSYEAGRSDQ